MSELLLRRRNLLMRKQEEELNIRAVCFKADGEQTVAITKVGSAPTITMQYSYDGVTWDAWDLSALPFGGSTKVYVRGVGNARWGSDKDNHNRITFGTDAFVYVSGIVESLLDGDNEVLTLNARGDLRQLFYQQTALRSAEDLRFEAQNASHTAYALMFRDCTNLIYAPKKISATTVGDYCYQYMFYGCTSLLTAPELPATTVGNYCYQYMFYGCTSLLTAPELPATKLGFSPYRDMFYGCTSLIKAPSILPATTIGSWAYGAMFYECTSLEDAPELPAETLADSCYWQMFDKCTSLKSLKCRAKVTKNDATHLWMNGVNTAGTFYGHSEYGWASGTSGIPSGWEFVELTD